MNNVATLIAVIVVIALGIALVISALWADEIHAADNDARERRQQPGMVWLDCSGPCLRLHGPHVRHDDGRVTCCLCGGPHLSSIPRQREASDGS